jgi:hypothetical protein
MDPHDFEKLILILLKKMGYNTKATPKTGDMGVDGYAEKDGFKIIVQAKRYKNAVPFQYIPQFYGVVEHEKADQGIFATTSTISEQGAEFLKGKPIVVWNKWKIIGLIQSSLEPGEFPGGIPIHKYSKFNRDLICEGMDCPNCSNGKVVIRKRRSDGKPFYGCSKWPACSFLQNITNKPKETVDNNVTEPVEEAPVIAKSNEPAIKKQASTADNTINEYTEVPDTKTGWRWYYWIILFVLIKGLLTLAKLQ